VKVGFIGAGNVAGTIGRHLITAGHTIIVSNSRGPETLVGFVSDLGPGAIAGTKEQAAECDVVILAVHWVNVREALKGRGSRLPRSAVSLSRAGTDPEPLRSEPSYAGDPIRGLQSIA